jgi:cytochrome c551/c552
MEDPATDLGKFRNQRTGTPASKRRGVDLSSQHYGGCQVCAARETALVGPSWKLEELSNMSTDATAAYQILLRAF